MAEKPSDKTWQLWIGFSDVHIPYHDKKAWKLLIKFIKEIQPDGVVCLGDLLDFYQLSKFTKKLSQRRPVANDIFDANILLDELDEALPKKVHDRKRGKIYCMGNHEARLERFIDERADALEGLVDLPIELNLAARGYELVKYGEYARLGRLHLVHDLGWYGKYALFHSQAAINGNLVMGHTHRQQTIVVGSARGKDRVAASFGWLGDVNQIQYGHRLRQRSEWTHGFGAILYNRRTGDCHVTPIPVVNGACTYGGQVISIGGSDD